MREICIDKEIKCTKKSVGLDSSVGSGLCDGG